jgi:ATP-dependent Clp protease protease subunit
MAHGRLDDEAATRLSAQLLTLDAENMQPIRLELQGLDAELPAALSLMGVLDVVRAPVSAYVGGRISGPALGVLAAADHRYTYPSALFILCEPRMQFDGTVTDELQADFEHQRVLTAGQAIDYGLVQGPAEPRRPAHAGLQP